MSRSASEVSVVTINWNGKQHLSHLLPSLVPLGPKEIIVVDNGSEDDSVTFLRDHFPQVKIIQNQINLGFAEPNNLAARSARGNILALVNNDMRVHSEWLKNALQRMDRYRVVGSRILDWEGKKVDYNGSSLQYLGYALQKDLGELAHRVSHRDEILFPCGGAMLIDRELFLRLGGFDQDYFAIFEDVDLGWRVWLSGDKIAYAPDSIVYHRGHSTLASQGNSKVRYLMHRNALLTIIKNYEEDSFRRILPLALIMAIKRAVRCSGVRKESFHFWSEQQENRPASDQLQDALIHLVAVEDVLDSLPETLSKRKRIQALRKRSDAEILNLFEDPLRAIVDDPEYIEQEIRYLKLLRLDELFPVDEYQESTAGLDDQLSIKVAQLREELTALQWQELHALSHPGSVRQSGFLQLWRSVGFRKALNYSLQKIRRGL